MSATFDPNPASWSKDDFSSFPQRVQNTTDTLLDLTGRNVSDFLVKTYKDSGRTRYRRGPFMQTVSNTLES